MTSLKSSPSWSPVRAVVIGDVVGSRHAGDRAALHDRLRQVLDRANDELDPVAPLRVTVGDEYQGAFAEVGQALRATTWLRVQLLAGEPVVDVRHGVGRGVVQTLQQDPPVEDGPAWWVARDALGAVEAESRRAGRGTRRTGFRDAEQADPNGPDPALVEALLVCQDLVVGSLSPRSLRLLRGLLAGEQQLELAEAEGISPSAVSQRVRRDGLPALVAIDEELRRMR